MKTVYRVMVVREADELNGVPEVLFEAASPDAARLLGYAPAEVHAALREIAGDAVPATVHHAVAYDTTASTPTAVMASTTPDGPTVEVPVTAPAEPMTPFPVPPEGKPKRTRRTKAQIAADEAAAAAANGTPQTPDGSTVSATPPAELGAPGAPLTLVPPLPAAEPSPLMTQPHDVPAGSVPVVGQQPAGPPEAPYNPFMQ